MVKQKAVVLSTRDNVATALTDLKAGETLALEAGGTKREITLTAAVPLGHKFSVLPIAAGEPIIKYGEVIGSATGSIKPGDYVHVHNVAAIRGRGDLKGGK